MYTLGTESPSCGQGAESDSDAPPDERAPAFFVNEDGTKARAAAPTHGA